MRVSLSNAILICPAFFAGQWRRHTRCVGKLYKFGQLIFRKIIKIVATRCHILRLKHTKFDFGRSSHSGGTRILQQVGPAAGPKVVW